MAWDSRRGRAGPLPWTATRDIFENEQDAFNIFSSDSNCTTDDAEMDTRSLLSSIQEEGRFSFNDSAFDVKVTIRFLDPLIRSVYTRSYASSLVPSARICRGLLRRIEHCSEELITRKDSDALKPVQSLRQTPKPLRFEITFKISRRNAGTFAETSFKSYQKKPLNTATANEVVRSTHFIIGNFLLHHDENFELTDEPAREYFPDRPATVKPSRDSPPTLLCVPPSRFIESSQSWEFIPGFSLELSFKSHNQKRRQPCFAKTVRVSSTQSAPLTLGMGEDLLWQADRALHGALDARKDAFDIEHVNCEALEGLHTSCQHFNEGALDIELSIVNNLGPDHDHLHRSIHSKLQIFKRTQDCDEFVRTIHSRFQKFRDMTDERLEKLNDIDIRIVELRGHGWQARNPARFVVGGSHSHSHRSVEAILDRIRTSVHDVLRGKGVAIHLVGFKRGHLILDKVFAPRKDLSVHLSASTDDLSRSPDDAKQILTSRLKDRIQRDLDLICRDTCSIDDIPEEPTSMSQDVPRPTAPRPSIKRVFPLVPAKFTEVPTPDIETVPQREFCNIDEAFEEYETTISCQSSAQDLRTPDTNGDVASFETFTPGDYSSSRASTPGLSVSDGQTPSPGHSRVTTPSRALSGTHGPFLKDTDLTPLLETAKFNPYQESADLKGKLSGSSIGMPPSSPPSETASLHRQSSGRDHVSNRRECDLLVPVTTEASARPVLHNIEVSDSDSEESRLEVSEDHEFLDSPSLGQPEDENIVSAGTVLQREISEATTKSFSNTESTPSEVDQLRCSESESSEDRSYAVLPDYSRTSEGAYKSPNNRTQTEETNSEASELQPSESESSDASDIGSGDDTRHFQDDLSRSKVDFFEAEEVEAEAMTTSPMPKPSESSDQKVTTHVWKSSEVSESDMQAAENGSSEDSQSDQSLIGVRPTSSDSEPVTPERSPKVVFAESSVGLLQERLSDQRETGIPELLRLRSHSSDLLKSWESSIAGLQSPEASTSAPESTPTLEASLLPPLPIISNRTSLSSEWEDYISDARVSSDSVDTIASVDTVKLEEDIPQTPGTPQRLRTPTAGLLGLPASHWADLGFRGILTGSHQFDRPSTAPILRSNTELVTDVKEEIVVEEEFRSLPRKRIHLRHKRSKTSVLMTALKLQKENKAKKEPKVAIAETRVSEQVRAQDAAALPRAMMLFATLAIASQAVSKSA